MSKVKIGQHYVSPRNTFNYISGFDMVELLATDSIFVR